MIRYVEKGAGLHRKIAAAGHSMAQVDGAWIASDEAAVQAIIDGYTLAEAVAEVAAQIDAHADEIRERVASRRPPSAVASWGAKATEARAYRASGDAGVAPILSLEAHVRGVALDEMAESVLGNAAPFEQAEAVISGTAGRHKDALKALTDFASILAYDWRSGWPDL